MLALLILLFMFLLVIFLIAAFIFPPTKWVAFFYKGTRKKDE